MLQIYLYGPTENGWLDIEPGTVLEMESLADIFDEDLSTGEFSLPVKLPWTDNNRRLFGFAERLENFSNLPPYYKADVYDKNWPEIFGAQVTILEKAGTFSYRRGAFNVSVSGTKGLFGSLIKNKMLSDLHLGGAITWEDKESRAFATDLMKGLHPEFPQILFVPVAIENFIDAERKDYAGEFLAKDTVNTVVITGIGSGEWVFGRPKSSAPNTPTAPGEAEHLDFYTVPFFKVKYVVQKIFEEHGFSVSGDFIEGTDFDDLLLFNNYGIEDYAPSVHLDFNRTIVPGNHMPPKKVAEFLKGIFSFFNLYPTFPRDGEVKLIYRKTVLRDRRILSITGRCSAEFSSQFASAENEKGYKLAYTWDSNDSYYSDRVKDLQNKTLVAEVGKFSDLWYLDIGRPLTTEDIAYVQGENLYYVIADSTTLPLKWDAYAERLNDHIVGEGERSVDIGVSTLCAYVEFNAPVGLYEKRYYVGTRQSGNYRNKAGVRVTAPFDIRIFYGGTDAFFANLIPVSTSHNRNYNNEVVRPYSLAWTGDDGIAKNFHAAWQEVKGKAEIVKTRLEVDQKVLEELRAANTLEHDGVLFLPYKLERTIPMTGEAMPVELVPL